jgi:hypothetical protein
MTHILTLIVTLLGLAFMNGLNICFYIYRRETAQKVTTFFRKFSDLIQNVDFRAKKRPFDRPMSRLSRYLLCQRFSELLC